MADKARDAVTQHLASGDREGLLAIVYTELRQLADRHMVRERKGHTLQATALIHEAYLRLADGKESSWDDRAHFFAAIDQAMRRILIEHARRARGEKRGGAMRRVTLGAVDSSFEVPLEQTVALYDMIDQLEQQDARAAAVTRLRFLAGLGVEETAQVLSISVRSVHREWRYARAWLFDRLKD